jgi:Dolichyl-phosphate-mannose-protein mannosyltransferase
MKLDRWAGCGVVVCAVALTRFLFRSHYLYDIDSVNFALALDHFDPTTYQPHPPGYFLYVFLGRLVNLLFHDPNTALVTISILASCGTAVLIWVLAEEWFGRQAALFSSLIFLFSPLCWFHGTVALTYIVEACFSALLGLLCWRVVSGRLRWLMPATVTLGLAVGFRPSSLLLLGPLWLLSLRELRVKQVFLAFLALVVTIGAWFVPMLYLSGGPAAYFESLYALWRMVPGKQTIFNSGVAMSLARFCVVAAILGLCFGTPLLLVFRRRAAGQPDQRRKAWFTWVWITPSLLFFTFVFLAWVNSGYLLALTPPLFCWLGSFAAAWYGQAAYSRPWKIAAIGASAVVNTAFFLFAPLYCSWSSVRSFEKELMAIQSALPRAAAPEETLIVGFDSHFLGYRHAAYYLPDYLTLQFPEVRLPEGMRVFAVQHRRTRLLTSIPTSQFKNFVFFPLPAGESDYGEYFAGVRGRFRQGVLHPASADGRAFLVGSTSELDKLFPTLAPKSARLYTSLHAGSAAVYGR